MYEIMKAINNFFTYKIEYSTFEIVADGIVGTFDNTYLAGMYIVLNGTYLNDGVYKIASVTSSKITVEETLTAENTNENFYLANCKIPQSFIDLSTEIATWKTNNTGIEGVASESIDDYSISYDTQNGTGWISAFYDRLTPYRKMYNDFETAPARNRYRYGRC